jgi:tetratricopeptide (TPR) repeat protein
MALSTRMEQLRRLLERSPDDAFLLYAIALEHKKAGDSREAIEFLDRVVEVDSLYCYAYHQRGLVYESLGDLESARRAYREGIEAATKANDPHARGEIEAALSLIE